MPVLAWQRTPSPWQVFAFTSDFRTVFGAGSLEGRLATDGARHRLTVYWFEPRLIRDSTHFIPACDLLFLEDATYCWLPGMSKPSVFSGSEVAPATMLPRQNDTTSVIRSVLAIVHCLRSDGDSPSAHLNLRDFLQESRTRTEYVREFTSPEQEPVDPFSDAVGDAQVVNAPPMGREYKKELSSDGKLIWRLMKVLEKRLVVGATVERIDDIEDAADANPFDTQNLGRWPFAPEPCRAYWSFRLERSRLDASSRPQSDAENLCDKIAAYLATHETPSTVRRAIEFLWAETAFTTGDVEHVRQALEALVTGFCEDDTVSYYQALLEMAELADVMEAEYPQQFRIVFETLLTQMVDHAGADLVECLGRLIRSIEANKRFRFGDLLFDVIGRRPCAAPAGAADLVARYEATRLAAENKPFDLSHASEAVQRYLAQFEDGPPQGPLRMEDLRLILQEGLTLPDPDAAADRKTPIADDVIDSLRRIAGDGPFQGDRATLTHAVQRFSHIYFRVCRNPEPIHPALTTFLALSFYDTSTSEEHQELCRQARRIGARLEDRINTSIVRWKLTSLISPDDVKDIVENYCLEEFRDYVDDPLCPTFKFPLTPTENARLLSRVELGLESLEPVYEEISLKVKYGGVSPQLKEQLVRALSHPVQNLLPTAAFLRRPSYPGSVYQYRGRHGFAGIIPETAYQEGANPQQEFRIMRYFHLGHRLPDVSPRAPRQNPGASIVFSH